MQTSPRILKRKDSRVYNNYNDQGPGVKFTTIKSYPTTFIPLSVTFDGWQNLCWICKTENFSIFTLYIFRLQGCKDRTFVVISWFSFWLKFHRTYLIGPLNYFPLKCVDVPGTPKVTHTDGPTVRHQSNRCQNGRWSRSLCLSQECYTVNVVG